MGVQGEVRVVFLALEAAVMCSGLWFIRWVVCRFCLQRSRDLGVCVSVMNHQALYHFQPDCNRPSLGSVLLRNVLL